MRSSMSTSHLTHLSWLFHLFLCRIQRKHVKIGSHPMQDPLYMYARAPHGGTYRGSAISQSACQLLCTTAALPPFSSCLRCVSVLLFFPACLLCSDYVRVSLAYSHHWHGRSEGELRHPHCRHLRSGPCFLAYSLYTQLSIPGTSRQRRKKGGSTLSEPAWSK